MLFADKIIDIINVLENDGVILLPTDTIWSVACSLKSEFGLRKIQSIINIDESPAICVSSIEDLKKYAPFLHPRVETLLCYYKRPITILEQNFRNVPDFVLKNTRNSTLGIRVCDDEFIATILSLLGHPMLLYKAHFKQESAPKAWIEVHETFKQNADYICKHRMYENGLEDGVQAGYDHEGMLLFDEDSMVYGS